VTEYKRRPSRQNKRGVTFWVDDAEFKRLRYLSVVLDLPVQEIARRGLMRIFEEHADTLRRLEEAEKG